MPSRAAERAGAAPPHGDAWWLRWRHVDQSRHLDGHRVDLDVHRRRRIIYLPNPTFGGHPPPGGPLVMPRTPLGAHVGPARVPSMIILVFGSSGARRCRGCGGRRLGLS